jgi:hypothetical protein
VLSPSPPGGRSLLRCIRPQAPRCVARSVRCPAGRATSLLAGIATASVSRAWNSLLIRTGARSVRFDPSTPGLARSLAIGPVVTQLVTHSATDGIAGAFTSQPTEEKRSTTLSAGPVNRDRTDLTEWRPNPAHHRRGQPAARLSPWTSGQRALWTSVQRSTWSPWSRQTFPIKPLICVRTAGFEPTTPVTTRTLRLTFSQVSRRACSQVLFAKALDVHDRAKRVVPGGPRTPARAQFLIRSAIHRHQRVLDSEPCSAACRQS